MWARKLDTAKLSSDGSKVESLRRVLYRTMLCISVSLSTSSVGLSWWTQSSTIYGNTFNRQQQEE